MAENKKKKNLPVIAARVKQIRAELGLSMEEFAKLVGDGAGRGTVGNWESGLNAPGASRLRTIADLGHTTVDYVLGETDDQEVADTDWWTDFMDNAARVTEEQRAITEAFQTEGVAMAEIAKHGDADKIKAARKIIEAATKNLKKMK